jgi:hypothetical protein
MSSSRPSASDDIGADCDRGLAGSVEAGHDPGPDRAIIVASVGGQPLGGTKGAAGRSSRPDLRRIGGVAAVADQPHRIGVIGSALAVASLAIVLLGVVAYVLGPILDNRIPTIFRQIDWISYSAAAGRFIHGQPLYVAAQLAGPYQMADVAGIGYVYPPPSILLFVPFLALGPTAWALANALLFASGIAAMARRDFGPYAGLAFGVALLTAGLTAPYLDAMVMGNINLGLAGLFAWSWALGRGSRPIGWMSALGGLIKLHPFALIGWTRPSQARRTIGVAITVAAVVTLITLPVVGLGNWLDFGRAAINVRPLCGYGYDAVACPLTPFLGDLATPTLFGIAGLMVVTAIWTRSDSLSFALIVVAITAAHPEVFTHSFLLVEVLAFAIAGSVWRYRREASGDVAPTAVVPT